MSQNDPKNMRQHISYPIEYNDPCGELTAPQRDLLVRFESDQWNSLPTRPVEDIPLGFVGLINAASPGLYETHRGYINLRYAQWRETPGSFRKTFPFYVALELINHESYYQGLRNCGGNFLMKRRYPLPTPLYHHVDGALFTTAAGGRLYTKVRLYSGDENILIQLSPPTSRRPKSYLTRKANSPVAVRSAEALSIATETTITPKIMDSPSQRAKPTFAQLFEDARLHTPLTPGPEKVLVAEVPVSHSPVAYPLGGFAEIAIAPSAAMVHPPIAVTCPESVTNVQAISPLASSPEPSPPTHPLSPEIVVAKSTARKPQFSPIDWAASDPSPVPLSPAAIPASSDDEDDDSATPVFSAPNTLRRTYIALLEDILDNHTRDHPKAPPSPYWVCPMTPREASVYAEYTSDDWQAASPKTLRLVVGTLVAKKIVPYLTLRLCEDKALLETSSYVLTAIVRNSIEDLSSVFSIDEDPDTAALTAKIGTMVEEGDDFDLVPGPMQIYSKRDHAGDPASTAKLTEIKGIMTTLFSGLSVGPKSALVALQLGSLGTQVWLAATEDWSAISTTRKVVLVSGITASIVCSVASIYELLCIKTNITEWLSERLTALFYKKKQSADNLVRKLIKIILLAFVMTGYSEKLKNLNTLALSMKSVDALYNELLDTKESIAELFSDQVDELTKDIDKLVVRVSTLAGCNVASFLKAEHATIVSSTLAEVHEVIARLGIVEKSSDPKRATAAKHLILTLVRAESALASRRTEAISCGIASQMVRPEPVMINIWGERGHGKSTWVTGTLIPWLETTFKLRHGVVSTTGTSKYAPIIGIQDIMLIDEFLANGPNDPWLENMCGLVSCAPMSLDSAFVKGQQPVVRFVITISNLDPATANLTGGNMTNEAVGAFRSRVWSVKFVNAKYDPTKSRYDQKKHVATFFDDTGRQIFESDIHRRLAERQLKCEDNYEKEIQRARDRLASAYPGAFGGQSQGRPQVVTLSGKPGAGKTRLAQMIASHIGSVLKIPTFSMTALSPIGPERSIIILDDLIVGKEDEYLNWFDRLTENHILITTNNITLKTYQPYLATRTFRGYSYATYFHSDDIKRVGTYRRLGFSLPYIHGTVHGVNECAGLYLEVDTRIIYTISSNGDRCPTTFSNVTSQIMRSVKALTHSAAVMEVGCLPPINEAELDIDVHVSSFDKATIAQALTLPTKNSFIRRADRIDLAQAHALFAKLQRHNGKLTPDAMRSQLQYVADNTDWKMRIDVPGLLCYVNKDVHIVDTASRLRFHVSDTALCIGTLDENNEELPLMNIGWNDVTDLSEGKGYLNDKFISLHDKQREQIMHYITSNLADHPKLIVPQTTGAVKALLAVAQASKMQAAAAVQEWLAENKLRLVIACLGAASTVIGGLAFGWAVYRHVKAPKQVEFTEDHVLINVTGLPTFAIPIEQLDQFECVPVHQSPGGRNGREVLYKTKKGKAGPTKFGREMKKMWDRAEVSQEAYEMLRELSSTDPRALRYIESFEESGSYPKKYQGSHQAIKTFTTQPFSQDVMLDTITRKIERASCYVQANTGSAARGLFIQGRYVIANSHLFQFDHPECSGLVYEDGCEDDAEGNPIPWEAEIVTILPGRDITLLRVTSPRFVSKEKLVNYFCKQEDITHIDGVRLFLTGGDFSECHHARARFTGGKLLDCATLSDITDYKTTAGKLNRIVQVSWVGMRGVPTYDGHCGSVYLATNKRLSERRIFALHSVAVSEVNLTRGTLITQEELIELISVDKPHEAVHQGAPRPSEMAKKLEEQELEDYALITNPLPCDGAPTMIIRKDDALQLDFEIVNHEARPAQERDAIFEIPDTSRFLQLGRSRKSYRPAGGKTGFLRSDISRYTTLPNTTKPAYQISHKVEEPAKSALTKMGPNPSLTGTQVSKLATENCLLRKDVLAKVAAYVIERYAHVFCDWKPLTTREMMNGDEPSEFEHPVGGIDATKSVGYLSLIHHKFKKSEYLGQDDNKMFLWGVTPEARNLRERYEQIELQAFHGIHLVDPIECKMKDELLPIEKANTGKVRLFESVDFPTFLFQRRYQAHFVKRSAEHRIETPWTTGYNPHRESHRIYERLSQNSHLGENGDYSNFDKRIPLEIQRMNAFQKAAWSCLSSNEVAEWPRIIKTSAVSPCWSKVPWIRTLSSEMTEQPYTDAAKLTEIGRRNNLFSVVFSQNARELHIVDGIVYWTNGSFNSGCFVTNFDDTLTNINARLYVCYLLLEGKVPNPLALLDQAMVMLFNGDDTVTSIGEELRPYITFKKLQEEYKKIGMIYTPPTKDDKEVEDHIPVEDMDFSSRRFVQRGAFMDGALKKISIEHAFHWTRSNKPEELAQILDAALLESFFHGHRYYQTIRQEIINVNIKYLRDYGVPLPIRPKTYSEVLSLYTGSLSPGAIKCTTPELQKFCTSVVSTNDSALHQSISFLQSTSKSNWKPTIEDSLRLAMAYIEKKPCPEHCGTNAPKRTMLKHGQCSHPESKETWECTGVFCDHRGTIAEMAVHRCFSTGCVTCEDCGTSFKDYYSAANHHNSAHNKNGNVERYFMVPHDRLSFTTRGPIVKQSTKPMNPPSQPAEEGSKKLNTAARARAAGYHVQDLSNPAHRSGVIPPLPGLISPGEKVRAAYGDFIVDKRGPNTDLEDADLDLAEQLVMPRAVRPDPRTSTRDDRMDIERWYKTYDDPQPWNGGGQRVTRVYPVNFGDTIEERDSLPTHYYDMSIWNENLVIKPQEWKQIPIEEAKFAEFVHPVLRERVTIAVKKYQDRFRLQDTIIFLLTLMQIDHHTGGKHTQDLIDEDVSRMVERSTKKSVLRNMSVAGKQGGPGVPVAPAGMERQTPRTAKTETAPKSKPSTSAAASSSMGFAQTVVAPDPYVPIPSGPGDVLPTVKHNTEINQMGAETPLGAPAELIAMTGSDQRLITHVYAENISSSGNISSVMPAGEIFAKIIYGTIQCFTPTALAYIKLHDYFSGSMLVAMEHIINFSNNGIIFFAWAPNAPDFDESKTPDIRWLKSFQNFHCVSFAEMDLQAYSLNDIRQDKFYRSTSEIYDANTTLSAHKEELARRPRIYAGVYFPLANMNVNEVIVPFNIKSQLSADFAVNNYRPGALGESTLAARLPIMSGRYLVLNGIRKPKQVSQNLSTVDGIDPWRFRTTLELTNNFDWRTGTSDTWAEIRNTTNATVDETNTAVLFVSGTIPSSAPFPVKEYPTFGNFMDAFKRKETMVGKTFTSDFRTWRPAPLEGYVITIDDTVTLAGDAAAKKFQPTCRVIHYSSPWAQTSVDADFVIIIAFPTSFSTNPGAVGQIATKTFDNLINTSIADSVNNRAGMVNFEIASFPTIGTVGDVFGQPIVSYTIDANNATQQIVEYIRGATSKSMYAKATLYMGDSPIGEVFLDNTVTRGLLTVSSDMTYGFITSNDMWVGNPVPSSGNTIPTKLYTRSFVPILDATGDNARNMTRKSYLETLPELLPGERTVLKRQITTLWDRMSEIREAHDALKPDYTGWIRTQRLRDIIANGKQSAMAAVGAGLGAGLEKGFGMVHERRMAKLWMENQKQLLDKKHQYQINANQNTYRATQGTASGTFPPASDVTKMLMPQSRATQTSTRGSRSGSLDSVLSGTMSLPDTASNSTLSWNDNDIDHIYEGIAQMDATAWQQNATEQRLATDMNPDNYRLAFDVEDPVPE